MNLKLQAAAFAALATAGLATLTLLGDRAEAQAPDGNAAS